MDLLASLNMEGELPEQQTRMIHLMARHPEDFDLRLGFDACCTCGTSLLLIDDSDDKKKSKKNSSASSSSATAVPCPSCRCVSYCSEACRQQDAQALDSRAATTTAGDDEVDEVDKAMGHSSIICALLQTCRDDEAVEDEKNYDNHTTNMDSTRRQASLGRIRSEFQSYPATLANVLTEGPCYQDVLTSKSASTTTSSSSSSSSSSSKSLVVHVIGASQEAELWGDAPAFAMRDDDYDSSNSCSADDADDNMKELMMQAYAQALAELVERFQLDVVQLIFVGPDCPSRNLDLSCAIPSSSLSSSSKKSEPMSGATSGQVVLKTFKGEYHELVNDGSNDLSERPDICVFFNPGFTVPDYGSSWRETLAAIPVGTPFLSCTNTELEGIADVQFLLDQDKVQSIPPGMADIFGLHYEKESQEEESSSFFSENPFCGTRVRQSGTMANDLFVKNRWMLGGIMDSFDPSRRSSFSAATATASPKKRKTNTNNGDNNNTKSANPALI